MGVIVILAIFIVAIILTNFIGTCYASHRYRAEQNRQYQRLMREKMALRRNAMDAYRAMIREACREGGFWENANDGGNEDAEEY